MKKVIISILFILLILIAIAMGYVIYKSTNKYKNQYNNSIAEDIEDDCTYEYEFAESNDSILETTANQEKITPNTVLILKKYYIECQNVTEEYVELSDDMINMTKEELSEEYKGWEIEKFSPEEIILYKEFSGRCDEHYKLKINNNVINVYSISEDGKEILLEQTGISIEYLPENDLEDLKNGIDIHGREALNTMLEDFE